ncbi:hypothetical protein FB451DRAFT_1121698 [Mycena latifolia]|nr:hypothetical protein FB451DRAFT_1121698 [Mycena latifolia]
MALDSIQEAVELSPGGHPDRARRLETLAGCMNARYRRLGDINDLETAVQQQQEAVDLAPEGHPNRAQYLHNLAVSLRDGYLRLGEVSNLEAVLQANTEAVNLTPDGHSMKATYLPGLATALTHRYEELGDVNDLKLAVEKHQEVVRLTSVDHIDRAWSVHCLASCLLDLYKKSQDLNVLDMALDKFQELLEITPSGHPDRAERLQDLAGCFAYQYRHSGKSEALHAVHTHYSASFNILTSSPDISWHRALDWVKFATQFQPEDCLLAHRSALNLLPELLWIGHSVPVRQDILRRLDIGQATSAAVRTCLNISNLRTAVEIVEQGLATTFQQMNSIASSDPDQDSRGA